MASAIDFNNDSKETQYVKHALNLALRNNEINKDEKSNMLLAWLEAEVRGLFITHFTFLTTLTFAFLIHSLQSSEEGSSHEGRMEKLKKLFGAEFGSKGPQLFTILAKSMDKIRAIVKEKKRKQFDEEVDLLYHFYKRAKSAAAMR